jgi:hypothetical protein
MMTRLAALLFAVACVGCGGDVITEFDSSSITALDSGGSQFGANIDDVMWYWNVSWADVKDTPDWAPGTEPAISMPQAIQLAQSEMTKYSDTPAAYRLDGVEWLPIAQCCNPNHASKWIYLVKFERTERFASGARGTMMIPILLDGRAIVGVKQGGPGKQR